MSVYKMVEVVGTSGTSVSDAIRGAVERASMTLEDVGWFEVKEIRGQISDGEISEFQVRLAMGFLLHAPKKETGDKGTSVQDKRLRNGGTTRQTRSITAQAVARRGGKGKSNIARGFREQPGRKR